MNWNAFTNLCISNFSFDLIQLTDHDQSLERLLPDVNDPEAKCLRLTIFHLGDNNVSIALQAEEEAIPRFEEVYNLFDNHLTVLGILKFMKSSLLAGTGV